MGLLRHADGDPIVLLHEHLLGRSSRCDTRLQERDTSGQHLLLYFQDGSWWARDLGSVNGTRCDHRALKPGVPERLKVGARLLLGARESLTLVDDSPPLPTALCLETQQACVGSESLVLIPSAQAPIASIALCGGSQWWLEYDAREQRLHDGAVFACGGASYRFHAGRSAARTTANQLQERVLRDVSLAFEVSRDEEHVHLYAIHADQRLDLGSRTHHYTTLCLARLRAADRDKGELPESSHGWVDSAELIRQLASNETKLSVEICRIRQQFAQLGFVDAADLIERRRGSGQLRLGIAKVEITRV